MSNLKIGDRVVRSGEHHYIADGEQNRTYDLETKVGQRGRIVGSHADVWKSESWAVQWDNGRGSAIAGVSLTLESEYDATAEPTYKVGQKVRVIADTNSSDIPLGTIVTLTKKYDNPDFKWRTDYTKEYMVGSLVTESDIEPVGDDRIEVDPAETYPQIGDEVTLRYLPTGQEFTSTVHDTDYGYSVLGWTMLRETTYAEQDLEDVEVTEVLRTVTPEPVEAEEEEDPAADNHVPGTILKGSVSYGTTYLYKVREGYEEKQWNDTVAEWRAFYDDGSTGMWTWQDIRSGLFGETEVFQVGRGDN